MKLSVVILPAKILADNTHKLRIAISHNGTTRYFLTRFVVPSEDCLKNGVVTSKISNATYINQQLRLQMNKIYETYDSIEDSNCYTCSQLIKLITDRMNHSNTNTFDFVAKEWFEIKRFRCKASSCDIYELSIKRFVEFAGRGILLQSITPQLIWKYDNYLKKSYNQTSINMIIRPIRSIISFAKNRKYVEYPVDPFSEYKMPNSLIRDCSLSVSVLRKIRDYEPSSYSARFTRDIFLLSFYLCGMNIVDIESVDLSKDSISLMRQKTEGRRKDGIRTEFTIQPEAREIIDRYISKNGKINIKYHLKSKSNANLRTCVNSCLKTIARRIGYDGRLVFYSARKTFSQLCFVLDVPERIIAYCLGDAFEGKNVLGYYVKSNKNLADKNIRKVFDFVDSDKTEEVLFSDEIV